MPAWGPARERINTRTEGPPRATILDLGDEALFHHEVAYVMRAIRAPAEPDKTAACVRIDEAVGFEELSEAV
ncbi:hypothetical protein EVJ58_g6590 [Rhodofomes roseus]|uniref:Uncharacterized protein n=1 Tax=Rhodofomes roseus TaxID=34475 RepID=A0A4Y9Y733_9APHY|nr:hypothetical protein EVJ58_g6590 [Rhodofomes roseus]